MMVYLVVQAWPNGNAIGRINEVNLRRPRLVLRRVTVGGYSMFIHNQPLRPTQPPTLSGTENEYLPRGSALRPGR